MMDYEMEGELDLMQQAELEAEAAEDNLQQVEGGQEAEVEEVDADNADNDANERVVVKPKKIVRNPQPKLNAETLRGPRGLTALPALFAKQKFKGKGHEEADLNIILKTYEYWCHRLFPKLQFDQCIDRIESIGSKKPIVTYIKKIRTGLVDDEMEQEQLPLQEEETEGNEIEMAETQIETVESRFDSLRSSNHQLDPQDSLTEEQMERIRSNKERAMQLRKQRLQAIRDKAAKQISANPQETSSQHRLNPTNVNETLDNVPQSPENLQPTPSTSNSSRNFIQCDVNTQSQDLFLNSTVNDVQESYCNENIESDCNDIDRMLEQEEEMRSQLAEELEIHDDYLSSLAQ